MKAPKIFHDWLARPFSWAWDKVCKHHQRNQHFTARRKAIGRALMAELEKQRHGEAVERLKQRQADMPYYPDGNVIRIRPRFEADDIGIQPLETPDSSRSIRG
jgi:hypothetical protein